MKAKKHLNLSIPLWWPSGPGWQRMARWLLPTPGNVLFTLLIVGGLLWAASAGALPFRAPALAGNSTTTISYQGRLADSSGNPITTSGVGMQFRLYNTNTGGSPLWEESHTAVPVEDGLFHVLLGSTNPIPVSLLASNSTLWLGITVGSDSEMMPREQIASVPYAMIASTVPDGTVTAAKLADGAANANLKSGGHIVLSPDANKLVKLAVLRQDNTSNDYESNQVMLMGWGSITGNNTASLTENINFGITFSNTPIVIANFVGYHVIGGGYPPGWDNVYGVTANAQHPTTTGFKLTLYSTEGPFGSSYDWQYTWIAIGTLD